MIHRMKERPRLGHRERLRLFFSGTAAFGTLIGNEPKTRRLEDSTRRLEDAMPFEYKRRRLGALEERSWLWTREWTAKKEDVCEPRRAPAYVKGIERVWHETWNKTLCHDGSGYPRVMSRLLAGGLEFASFGTTHGKWRDDRWGPPLTMVGPPGAHAVATDWTAIEPLAGLLGASPTFKPHMVFDGSLRATDSQETLCKSHIDAFLGLVEPTNLTRKHLLGETTIFASLVTSIERLDDGAPLGRWRWRHTATTVTRQEHRGLDDDLDQRHLGVRLHVAVESKLRGQIVVNVVNPTRCHLVVSVVDPWFLEFLETPRIDFLEPSDAWTTTPTHLWDHDIRHHATVRVETDGLRIRIVRPYRARLLNDKDWPYDQFRGFDVPPAMAQCARHNHTAISMPYLIMLPEHDRSMVFNVITIYSTVLAFIFGSVMTTVVRKSPQKHPIKLRPADPDDDDRQEGQSET